jgi:hypothetical protein
MQRRRTFFRRWLRPTFGAPSEDGSAEELENEARRAEQLAVETLRAADAVDETHRAAAERADALGGAAASVARALRHLEDEAGRARAESVRLERELTDLRARADRANEEALDARMSADSALRTTVVPEDDPALPADAFALAHIPTPMTAAPPPPPGMAPRPSGAAPAPPPPAPAPAPPPRERLDRSGPGPERPAGAGLGVRSRPGDRPPPERAGDDPFTEALAAATGEGPVTDPFRTPEPPIGGPAHNGSSVLNRLSSESGTPMPDALERRAAERTRVEEPVPLGRFLPRSDEPGPQAPAPDRFATERRRPPGPPDERGSRDDDRRPGGDERRPGHHDRPHPPERDDRR